MEPDRRSAPVAREQRESRGEPAARTASPDAGAREVDAECFGVLVQPRQAGVAVVERTGIGMLGRQPILDGRADATEIATPAVEAKVLHQSAAEDEAAAVDPVDARQPADRVDGSVHPHDHSPGVRHLVVDTLDAVRQLWRRHLRNGITDCADGVVRKHAESGPQVERQLAER